MSKIGKLPVELPEGVEVKIGTDKVDVTGPNGSLSLPVEKSVTIDNSDNKLTVAPKDNSKKSKSLWGTVRSNLANMVKGVKTGFYRTLEIKGVGYKGSFKNNILTLSLGFSHNIKVLVPEDIKLTEVKGNSFTFYSHSKQRLGQFITTLRSLKPPEPYKGKGIIIEGEEVIRKEGKKK